MPWEIYYTEKKKTTWSSKLVNSVKIQFHITKLLATKLIHPPIEVFKEAVANLEKISCFLLFDISPLLSESFDK